MNTLISPRGRLMPPTLGLKRKQRIQTATGANGQRSNQLDSGLGELFNPVVSTTATRDFLLDLSGNCVGQANSSMCKKGHYSIVFCPFSFPRDSRLASLYKIIQAFIKIQLIAYKLQISKTIFNKWSLRSIYFFSITRKIEMKLHL